MPRCSPGWSVTAKRIVVRCAGSGISPRLERPSFIGWCGGAWNVVSASELPLAAVMSLEFLSLAHYGFDRAAEVMARGFEDYLVKINSSSALLLHLARSDSVDLAASRIVLLNREPLGAALVARRGWTCRLAGMALVREA